MLPLDAECGWLLSLPLFHVGGYAILFRVFLAGAALVLDDRSRPLRERLEQQPITHLSLVPTQLWRLLAEGFDPARTRLRELLLGGAAIPQPLVNRLSAMGLEPKVSYGLSEMGSQVCTGLPSTAGVVGKALPGREVCIQQGRSAYAVTPCLQAISKLASWSGCSMRQAGSTPATRGISPRMANWWWRGGSTTSSSPGREYPARDNRAATGGSPRRGAGAGGAGTER